jgi:hypothetical protein
MSGSAANGYSGKPVWQKLGLTAGQRVFVHDAPGDYAMLTGMPEGFVRTVGPRATFDLAHLFVTRANDLATQLSRIIGKLPAGAPLWISWPKRTSGVATDITEDTLRTLALPLGNVDVKVCAIDATWSGLKFVWRKERR